MTTNSSLSAPDNLLTLLSQTRRLVTYFNVSVCCTESEWCRKLIYPASVENDAGHNSLRWRPASLGLTNSFSLECWIKGNKMGSQVNYRWRFARMPKPVFSFPSHPASTLSNANLLLLYISPTAVDLEWDRPRQTYTGPNVINSGGRQVLFYWQILAFVPRSWCQVVNRSPHQICHVPAENTHTAAEWWTADVNWDCIPDVKSCSSKNYAVILSTICAPLS